MGIVMAVFAGVLLIAALRADDVFGRVFLWACFALNALALGLMVSDHPQMVTKLLQNPGYENNAYRR